MKTRTPWISCMVCHKTELWQNRALKTRSGPSYVCCQLEVVFEIQKGDAGKGLGETRTDALLPQPETGKISCVHRLPCARLTPGVYASIAAICA